MERLRRQRRRLALSAFLGLLGGVLLPFGAKVIFGVIGALAAILATAAVLLYAPQRRAQVLSVLIQIVLALLAVQVLIASPAVAVLLVLAGVGLYTFRPEFFEFTEFQLPTTITAQAQRGFGRSQDEIWTRLLPAECEQHWDPAIVGITCGRRPGVLLVHTSMADDDGPSRKPILVFDVEEPRHFKQRDMSLPEAEEGGPVRVVSTTIDPEGTGCRVTLIEATWQPWAWDAAQRWLDDSVGGHLDRVAAALRDGPERTVTAIRKPDPG